MPSPSPSSSAYSFVLVVSITIYLTAAAAVLDLMGKVNDAELPQGRVAAFGVDLLFGCFVRLISEKSHLIVGLC